MMRIYIIALVGIMCAGAYFAGRVVGRVSARAECNTVATTKYVQTVKQREKINDQTNHTAVRDIRRVLREKYTIAE